MSIEVHYELSVLSVCINLVIEKTCMSMCLNSGDFVTSNGL